MIVAVIWNEKGLIILISSVSLVLYSSSRIFTAVVFLLQCKPNNLSYPKHFISNVEIIFYLYHNL